MVVSSNNAHARKLANNQTTSVKWHSAMLDAHALQGCCGMDRPASSNHNATALPTMSCTPTMRGGQQMNAPYAVAPMAHSHAQSTATLRKVIAMHKARLCLTRIFKMESVVAASPTMHTACMKMKKNQ